MLKWILVLICALPFVGKSQQKVTRYKSELSLSVGLNSYLAFEFDPSYTYMFHRNIGITGGLRAIQEPVDNLHYDRINGPEYQWRISEKEKVSSLLFRPALRLTFPLVDDWFYITTEPGILLNLIPNERVEFAYTNTKTIEFPSRYKSVRNKNGDIFFYDLKTYVSIVIDNWALLAGYDLSTYDLYSGRRNIVVEGDALNRHLPSKKNICQAGFVGVSYLF